MIFVLSTFRAIFCWMQLKKLTEQRPRCSFSTPRVLAVACHGRAWHVLLSSCISEIAARLSQWTHIKGNFQLIYQLWTNRSSHPVSATGAALLPVQSRTEKAGLWSLFPSFTVWVLQIRLIGLFPPLPFPFFPFVMYVYVPLHAVLSFYFYVTSRMKLSLVCWVASIHWKSIEIYYYYWSLCSLPVAYSMFIIG